MFVSVSAHNGKGTAKCGAVGVIRLLPFAHSLTIQSKFSPVAGNAHILRTIAFVVREREQYRLHWIPISLAIIVLLFQVQYWFAFVHLVIVNSVMAATALSAYLSRKTTVRDALHGPLVLMTIYGLVTVWTPPSLEEPLTGTASQ